ncbi:hypothetical protein ACEPAF_4485 [Sanghuangporus sanghuang]
MFLGETSGRLSRAFAKYGHFVLLVPVSLSCVLLQAQIFAGGQASSGPSSYEARIANPHHDNYNHAGLPVQQWQAPNNTIPNTQCYAIDIPLPYDPTFVNAPSQQGTWPLMVSPNGNFNNSIFFNYAPQPVAPMVPPYMQSLGMSSFSQDDFPTIGTQKLYTGGEQFGTKESYAIQDSPGPVEIARKHDEAFSTDWPAL